MSPPPRQGVFNLANAAVEIPPDLVIIAIAIGVVITRPGKMP